MTARLSDVSLRRCAWAILLFIVASFGLGVPVTLMQGAHASGVRLSDLPFLLLVFSFPVTGVFILQRQPRNVIGWLLLVVGLFWGLAAFVDAYARYGLLVNPGFLPGPDVVSALGIAIWAPPIGVMGTYLILLYPDGRLPSPRWRPVLWSAGLAIALLTFAIDASPGRMDESAVPSLQNPLGIDGAKPLLRLLMYAGMALLMLSFIGSAWGLIHRFRRAVGVERMQLKWLATAGAFVAVMFVLAMTGTAIEGAVLTQQTGTPPWLGVIESVAIESFVLIPASIGAAILRYRLYDIDLVINKTLVYGGLTATLAVVYLGSVLLLQLALQGVTADSSIAIAASTLAVAALFRPLRNRVQAVVDKRFYRRRYDARRAVDSFAVRLREVVELPSVERELTDVVVQTVQPAHLTVWLRGRS